MGGGGGEGLMRYYIDVRWEHIGRFLYSVCQYLCTARNFSLPIFAHCKKSTACLYVETARNSSVHKCICRHWRKFSVTVHFKKYFCQVIQAL
jgi:hypothetical protein